MSEITIHLGQTLAFNGNPMIEGPESVIHYTRGALVVEYAYVLSRGLADEMRQNYPLA